MSQACSPADFSALTRARAIVSGLTPGQLRVLVASFDSWAAAASATPEQLAAPFKGSRVEALSSLPELASYDPGPEGFLLAPGDPLWPRGLDAVPAPPLVLFGRGTPSAPAPGVAVVGTREPTAYGVAVAQVVATAAAQASIPVHSGLAAGIDSVAHHAALDAGGSGAAVLGSGLGLAADLDGDASRAATPARPATWALARKLLDASGALLSELRPTTAPRGPTLMARNRLIAGLSTVLVPAEGSLTSGTRGAVLSAIGLGIPVVVALPRDLGSNPTPSYDLTRALIEPGAARLRALPNLPAAAKARLAEMADSSATAASGIARDRDELVEMVLALHRLSPRL